MFCFLFQHQFITFVKVIRSGKKPCDVGESKM